jgi:hypothetical protein
MIGIGPFVEERKDITGLYTGSSDTQGLNSILPL